ncbi:hypothetical protein Agub_g8381, partial [Astrephomene gubernaculifera]
MGVQGLTTQLEAGGRPHVVTLSMGEASTRKENLLLVDSSAVEYYLIKKLLAILDWKSTRFHKRLYYETCRYYGGLQRTGLRCVLIADSAADPGLEATYVVRRQASLAAGHYFMPPTAAPVMLQAYLDLGLEVVRSLHGADELLLAWAVRDSASLFAVLTNDSDFYVYGTPRIVKAQDVVVDARSVTFHTWSTDELWRCWRATALIAVGPGRSGAAAAAASSVPPLLRRAQVAAVLGNDAGKGLRHRLEMRRKVANRGAATAAATPNVAARAVVQLPDPPEPLTLEFFRREPVRLRNFTDADLATFNAIVQAYMDQYAAARDGSALRNLTLSPAVVPWLNPVVAARLAAGAAVPSLLPALACRGLCSLVVPEPFWSPQLALRRRVAALLFGDRAPGVSYEYDANGNALHVLVQSAAAAEVAERAEWFQPARHLPDLTIIQDGADAVPAVARQATLEETVRHLREVYPGLPPALVTVYALLLHAVDPDEAAWDEQQVRQLLLPRVPMRLGAAPAAAVAGEAADEEGDMDDGAAAPAANGGPRHGAPIVDVGSALNTEDWNDIDAKD